MTKVAGVRSPDRLLLQTGILLFLLGLITGFIVPILASPRLGVTAHLEGVMNGMFLIGFGLLWNRLSLPGWAGIMAFWTAVYGAYANWLSTLLAGVWGGSALLPIASAGKVVGQTEEAIVFGLLLTASLAMVLTCLLALWGLARRPAAGT